MLNGRDIVGRCDVVLITLDTLRYDVAVDALDRGLTPNLAAVLPGGRWEERHTNGSFTYAAHHAFFAGFLPTPAAPGPHPRPFAVRFLGSETITDDTAVFDAPDIVRGFADHGYHTACVGGVGFFNKQNPLGNVLPGLFAESHWSPALGVTDPDSAANQLALARDIADRTSDRLFLFINVSALHQPNCHYTPGATADSPATMADALGYVDRQLPTLFDAFRRRGPTAYILCADHGTAYGEDGYRGHRLAHPADWNVPYAELLIEPGA